MGSKLADLPASERVFIDANIFIYHFTGVSLACTQFLHRCEQGELSGVTSVNILLEVLHRLMMIEAAVKKLVTPGDVAKKLRAKPQVVKQLKDYQKQAQAVLEMGLEIFPLSAETVMASLRFRQEYGLMVNDSLTAALALAEGITALASSDRDFERVKELKVYSPTDMG